MRRCVAQGIERRLGPTEATETPAFIGLDEFAAKKRCLYHTAICNLDGGGRETGKQKMDEYLDSLPEPERIKGVAMDMHQPFHQAVEMCLPRAKVAVDKFHLIRQINGALDKARIRLQGGRSRRSKRRYLFKSQYILPKWAERPLPRKRQG